MESNFIEELIETALPGVAYLIDIKRHKVEIYGAVGVCISITGTKAPLTSPYIIKAPGQQIAITKELSLNKAFMISLLQNIASVSMEYHNFQRLHSFCQQ